MTSSTDLVAVVMAGGSGTRFWPLSRAARPKQLLPFAGGRSLLAATVERLAPLVGSDRTLIVTNATVAEAVRADLPDLPGDAILAEPVGRDTAPCIGWVAWRLAQTHPDAVMVVLPADHVIPDGAALCRALTDAAAIARSTGGLVTLGLAPTRPETGYGYLELGDEAIVATAHTARRVRRFVEKPDQAHAVAYLAAGNYRWNSGMFAWTVAAIVAAIRRHLPELAAGLDELALLTSHVGEAAALAEVYPRLHRTSIDFGVMEHAAEVWAVPVGFAWSDVGSWLGLEEVLGDAGSDVRIG
ncbi:MAG: mannose-1-phosphate guanylyltransferase, partial [Acidobacteria bacterium]|nr:mannose-1-phosphate guanylyltransferase [Acidobacteriota bacterium]